MGIEKAVFSMQKRRLILFIFHALILFSQKIYLSAGNDHNSVHAVELLEKVTIRGSNVLEDRAYGAKNIRAYISEQGACYVIPPQSHVSDPWPVGWWLYKERHLVECFFQNLKWFRRIATR